MSRILILCFLFLSTAAWAVPPLQVETELNTPESPLPFGKSAELVLTLTWNEKLKFEPPQAQDLELKGFVILDAFTTKPASSPGEKALQYHIVFTLFKPAKMKVGPIEFQTPQGKVESQELSLEFVGAKKSKDDKLDKLKPPKQTVTLSTSSFWRTWLGRLAACLAVVALVMAVLSHFRIFEAFLSPKRRALKKLKRLRSVTSDPGGTLIDLLEIYRDYLYSAYGLKTRESSTADILRQIDQDPRCRHLKGLTARIVVPTDLAKFAAKEVDSKTAQELLELTRQTLAAESRPAK